MTDNETRNENLAIEMIEYLQKNEMFSDVSLYLNNKRYSASEQISSHVEHTKYGPYHVTENVKASDYVEYYNNDTVTMTFEGPFHQAINYDDAVPEDIQAIADKYDMYYEQGYTWSLAFYEA